MIVCMPCVRVAVHIEVNKASQGTFPRGLVSRAEGGVIGSCYKSVAIQELIYFKGVSTAVIDFK